MPTNRWMLTRNTTKGYYQILFETQQNNHSSKEKWEIELGIKINKEAWRHIYQICHRTIKDNTYKWFQLRILYRILGTRSYLTKVNLSEDPHCPRCQNEIETIHHLLIACPSVQDFWKALSEYIKNKVNSTLKFTPFNIIFGYTLKESCQQPINTILMVAKKYIFDSSKKSEYLNLHRFTCYLQQVHSEQQLLSKLCDDEPRFDKSWQKWLPLIHG